MLDDELLNEAHELTGIQSRPQLMQAALEALVAREKSQRLAALGGSEPKLKPIPRRRSA